MASSAFVFSIVHAQHMGFCCFAGWRSPEELWSGLRDTNMAQSYICPSTNLFLALLLILSVCVKLKDKSNWFRSQFRLALLNLFHFTLLCQWSSNLVCKTSLLCESGPLEQMLLPVPICTLTADVCFLCHKLRLHYKADFSFENVSSSISTDLEGMFSWIIQPYKEPGRNTP